MRVLELTVLLIGYIAWPTVALIVGLRLVTELKGGLLAKIVRPGGTIEYGDLKLTVSAAAHEVEQAGITLLTPEYAEPLPAGADAKADELSPYDLVMTAWGDLAETVTQLAVQHRGYDDRRQVWANAEKLLKKGVIDKRTFEALRSVQAARNSMRRTGAIDSDSAHSYAQSAYSLKKHFESLVQG
jgi:hypothetical protein